MKIDEVKTEVEEVKKYMASAPENPLWYWWMPPEH
jgi:hypothetical protein